MLLHPVIQKFSLLIQDEENDLLSDVVLNKLLEAGATATEATMVLHLAFDVNLENAEEFVFNSGIFPKEEINDVAYKTYEYLYYNRSIKSNK